MRKDNEKPVKAATNTGAADAATAPKQAPVVNIQEVAVQQPGNNGVVVADGKKPDEVFEMVIVQKNEGGNDFHYGIKFTLPELISGQMDYVLGTALNALFRKMDLGKQTGVRIIDSRIPLELSIHSAQFDLDLGKIDQVYKEKIKLNNGLRSRLLFTKRIMAVAADLMKPLLVKRATELYADATNDVALAYGKQPKNGLPNSALKMIASSELVVTEKGEMVEA